MRTSYTEQEASYCNCYQSKQDIDWIFLNGSYVTEERLSWERKKGERSKGLSHSISSLKKKTRNSENQHNPGIIEEGGGEEGQSEERDCNTFLLWMGFYSCLLQCCRKSGQDKEDHLHSEGNIPSVQFLLYTIGLHLIGSTSWDLNANRDQTILLREHTPGNQAGGSQV